MHGGRRRAPATCRIIECLVRLVYLIPTLARDRDAVLLVSRPLVLRWRRSHSDSKPVACAHSQVPGGAPDFVLHSLSMVGLVKAQPHQHLAPVDAGNVEASVRSEWPTQQEPLAVRVQWFAPTVVVHSDEVVTADWRSVDPGACDGGRLSARMGQECRMTHFLPPRDGIRRLNRVGSLCSTQRGQLQHVPSLTPRVPGATGGADTAARRGQPTHTC